MEEEIRILESKLKGKKLPERTFGRWEYREIQESSDYVELDNIFKGGGNPSINKYWGNIDDPNWT